jgi:hypothetical protein
MNKKAFLETETLFNLLLFRKKKVFQHQVQDLS